MSVSSLGTSSGVETRVARNDERQTPIIPVQPINGICRVYITSLPVEENSEQFCRICRDTKSENVAPLVSPCRCTGSSRLVHQWCIENWLTLSGKESCDLCNYKLPLYRTLKPMKEWMSTPLDLLDGILVLVSILSYLSFIMTIINIVFQSILLSNDVTKTAIFNLTTLLVNCLWSIIIVITLTLITWCSPNWEEWRQLNTKVKLRELVYIDRQLSDLL